MIRRSEPWLAPSFFWNFCHKFCMDLHQLGKETLMCDQSHLLSLLGRLRTGDDRAAGDLFAEYEPAIRRTIRTRLRNGSLQRFISAEDICQSVMKSFFVRYHLGQYQL